MIAEFINEKQIIRVTSAENAEIVINALENAGIPFYGGGFNHYSLNNIIRNVEYYGYRNIYINTSGEIHYCDDNYRRKHLNEYKEVSIDVFIQKSVKLKSEMDLINYIRDNKVIVIVETKIEFDILRELYTRNVHEGYIYNSNHYPSQYERIYVRLFPIDTGFYVTGWDSKKEYYEQYDVTYMKFEDLYDMLE